MPPLLVLLCDWLSILGSLVLKVPQIAAVYRSGSVEGLSLQSMLLELFSFTVMLCYSAAHRYPLLSYFEYLLLVPQDLLLVLMTLQLTGNLTSGWIGALAWGAAVAAALATGLLPLSLVTLLLNVSMPIGWSSKIIQLRSILRSGDARAVSIATWLLGATTCVTRLVTVSATTMDTTLLLTFIVNLLLNVSVASAAYRHRHGPDRAKQQ